MLRQLLIGGLASTCNIVIHALIMTLVVRAAHAASGKYPARPTARLAIIMVATVLTLMVAHSTEVAVWALAYLLVGAAPDDAELMYFAFVNFTTLGYGDMVPTERWRLLGPMTAMNGVLLFGWSTAVIFEVLQASRVATERQAKQTQ